MMATGRPDRADDAAEGGGRHRSRAMPEGHAG